MHASFYFSTCLLFSIVRYLAFSIVLLNLNIQVSMLFYENVFMYEYLEGIYSSNKITSHVMF